MLTRSDDAAVVQVTDGSAAQAQDGGQDLVGVGAEFRRRSGRLPWFRFETQGGTGRQVSTDTGLLDCREYRICI